MAWKSTVEAECEPPGRVAIFDTTLRDGEQTPGVALTSNDKLQIAIQLDALGVDIIEAGFPITSRGEQEAVERIAQQNLKAEVCALARASTTDVDRALDCDVDSIHVFIATSDLHLREKLKLTREQALENAVRSIEYAKSHGVKVEFSAEDATRTDRTYLASIFKAVVSAGADRIDIPDTVGVAIPRGMFNLVKETRRAVPVPISVHCHDDMGMAVANSLASVEGGAEQIHVAVNGLGERAGNASLEEAVVALETLYGIRTNIKLDEIFKTSRLVSQLTGVALQPNKAIVGENAFAHESGIHTHGIISSPETYEPLSPGVVGHRRRFVAGKHAGKHGVEAMLKEMGVDLTKPQLDEVVLRVKEIGDKGRSVTDTDLVNLVEAVTGSFAEKKRIVLEDLLVVTGNKVTPTASVRVMIDGKEHRNSDFGVGPIDASIKAIHGATQGVTSFRLNEFRLEAITGGSDALANVVVKVEDHKGRLVSARAVREDIVMAGVEAIVNAANRVLALNSDQSK